MTKIHTNNILTGLSRGNLRTVELAKPKLVLDLIFDRGGIFSVFEINYGNKPSKKLLVQEQYDCSDIAVSTNEEETMLVVTPLDGFYLKEPIAQQEIWFDKVLDKPLPQPIRPRKKYSPAELFI
jgi:hypothetical protein